MERLTPLDIFNKDFKYAFRGYDIDEVNEFLDLIIKNFEHLIEENRQLREKLKSYQQLLAEREADGDTQDHNVLLKDILRRLERVEQLVFNKGD